MLLFLLLLFLDLFYYSRVVPCVDLCNLELLKFLHDLFVFFYDFILLTFSLPVSSLRMKTFTFGECRWFIFALFCMWWDALCKVHDRITCFLHHLLVLIPSSFSGWTTSHESIVTSHHLAKPLYHSAVIHSKSDSLAVDLCRRTLIVLVLMLFNLHDRLRLSIDQLISLIPTLQLQERRWAFLLLIWLFLNMPWSNSACFTTSDPLMLEVVLDQLSYLVTVIEPLNILIANIIDSLYFVNAEKGKDWHDLLFAVFSLRNLIEYEKQEESAENDLNWHYDDVVSYSFLMLERDELVICSGFWILGFY